MSTETNLSNLDADTAERVDQLAAGTARRQPKDGGALRAARKEQAASRKPAEAKSPAPKTPDPDKKLSREANRAVKRLMCAMMRSADFDALSKGDDDAYPELAGVKPSLMRAEVERHARYLEPKKDAK